MANSSGTCTITEQTYTSIKKIVWNWTTGSGTKVDNIGSGTTIYAYDGQLLGLQATGAAGATAPSNDYDITIKNQSSCSVLFGMGGSMPTTTGYIKGSSIGNVTNDTLTLGIANAGASNAGIVYLWIR